MVNAEGRDTSPGLSGWLLDEALPLATKPSLAPGGLDEAEVGVGAAV